ncbi:MAG: metalloregulator ArsR/SmtB family transcription factor [Deltaproteobacteria bacterium]|nr:metalloregulator ArsR/SmtB family transcription factor [Deltaproteobacteria bacterium]
MERVFMALSDETRRCILLLLENREHAVGEIVENFNLSQPTISRHLSVLREANLVKDERRGQRVIYSLNGHALKDTMRAFFGRFVQCSDELMEAPEGATEGEAQAEPKAWQMNGGAQGHRPASAVAFSQQR